jgi:pilus assembly protein CpaC
MVERSPKAPVRTDEPQIAAGPSARLKKGRTASMGSKTTGVPAAPEMPSVGAVAPRQGRNESLGGLESQLRSVFPASRVRLNLVAQNLLVEGQAKDEKEAAQIMAVVHHAAAFGLASAGDSSADSAAPADASQRPVALRVTNMLRVPEARKIALRIRVLAWDRAAAKGAVADTNGTAALAKSLLDAGSGRGAAILDSWGNSDLDRAIALLAGQEVLSPVYDQTVTTESGRSVTMIARGVASTPPAAGLASATPSTAAPRAQDLVVTCLPAVGDTDRILLRVIPEVGIAGRSAVAAGASRLGDAGGASMVIREGQTLAISGLEEDAVQQRLPGAQSPLTLVLKGGAPARGSKDLVVLVTPQFTSPSAEAELGEASGSEIRARR